MKGLELAYHYYKEYGEEMIASAFSEYADRIAVGLVGEGSECLGFDDELSRDHDFDPGFCLWITAEDERRFGFRLERAYSKLPKEFMGLSRQPLSPAGGNRRGVIIIEDFYRKFLGAPTAPDTLERWLYTPSAMLRSASNGEVWRDDLGIFSSVRDVLKQGYPEDVRRKKLASHLALAHQSGCYNYPRSLERGDLGAAQLSCFEFIHHAVSSLYLLSGEYEPFYKWAFRGLDGLEGVSDVKERLLTLSLADGRPESSKEKLQLIENVCSSLILLIKEQGLSKAACQNLDTHAFSVLDSVKDSYLRNMHIMEGV